MISVAVAVGIKAMNSPIVKAKVTIKNNALNDSMNLALTEYLALTEKFMKEPNLTFNFDYTLFSGENLDQLVENMSGSVSKMDSLYKMTTKNSELVIDSTFAVSLDHESKKIMLGWSSQMDRRYDITINFKKFIQESKEVESVFVDASSDTSIRTFKILPKNGGGYILLSIHKQTGFPKRVEIFSPADGEMTFDDSRTVITYSKIQTRPVSLKEFSYKNYFQRNDSTIEVLPRYYKYELLTNL